MIATDKNGWRGSPEYWEKLEKIYAARFRRNSGSYIFVPLAEAQARQGKTEEAIDTLEYGLALLPNSRAGRVALARLYHDAGKTAKARVILEDVVEKWPGAYAAVALLCEIHEKAGDYYPAERMAKDLTIHYPDNGRVKDLAARYEFLAANKRKETEQPCLFAKSAPARRGRGKTADPRQKTLFALESMLSNINKLKQEKT